MVAGERKKIACFKNYLTEKNIRAMDLHVSGAFHTPYMKRASQAYLVELKKIDFAPPAMDYYLNRTGKKYAGEDMGYVLAEHIDHPVRLFDNLKNMIDEGVERIIEIGPGDVLSRIIKKHFNEVEVISLKNEEDIMKR